MKRVDRQELIKGMDVVYIYHDKIDETAHTSEKLVFTACDEADSYEAAKQFLSLRITQLSMIGFSAAVSGALSSLNMNMWKRINADPQFSFTSSRLFRCLMWILRN